MITPGNRSDINCLKRDKHSATLVNMAYMTLRYIFVSQIVATTESPGNLCKLGLFQDILSQRSGVGSRDCISFSCHSALLARL